MKIERIIEVGGFGIYFYCCFLSVLVAVSSLQCLRPKQIEIDGASWPAGARTVGSNLGALL